MDLYQELQLRTQYLSPADVLQIMGYSRSDSSAEAHYLAILQSPYLGLEAEYRDARLGERSDFDPPKATFGLVGSDENLGDRFARDDD